MVDSRRSELCGSFVDDGCRTATMVTGYLPVFGLDATLLELVRRARLAAGGEAV